MVRRLRGRTNKVNKMNKTIRCDTNNIRRFFHFIHYYN